MNGKKDSQLVDTNYIKDGTESDTLDDPRLEKLWSKVGKISRNCHVENLCFFSSECHHIWNWIALLLCFLSTGQAAVLCSSDHCALRASHLHPGH